MRIALTGSSGFIGSHILTDLVVHGHEVSAVVRDDTEAEVVRAKGAKATVVDLYDHGELVKVLRDADGAVHTDITENSAIDAPTMVAWKPPLQDLDHGCEKPVGGRAGAHGHG
jgi:uncharacterized protein YbjT (DUF2867 family)